MSLHNSRNYRPSVSPKRKTKISLSPPKPMKEYKEDLYRTVGVPIIV